MVVRGALLSGQMVLMPVVAGLVASVGCFAVGVGVVVAPFYGSYMLIKRKRGQRK